MVQTRKKLTQISFLFGCQNQSVQAWVLPLALTIPLIYSSSPRPRGHELPGYSCGPFVPQTIQTNQPCGCHFTSQSWGSTWWLIPLSKWVITTVISGLTLLIPFITGVITHLLTGMSHQVLNHHPLLGIGVFFGVFRTTWPTKSHEIQKAKRLASKSHEIPMMSH